MRPSRQPPHLGVSNNRNSETDLTALCEGQAAEGSLGVGNPWPWMSPTEAEVGSQASLMPLVLPSAQTSAPASHRSSCLHSPRQAFSRA